MGPIFHFLWSSSEFLVWDVTPLQNSPVGMMWDGENYSCAYDALFTILCDVWIQDPKKWTKCLRSRR